MVPLKKRRFGCIPPELDVALSDPVFSAKERLEMRGIIEDFAAGFERDGLLAERDAFFEQQTAEIAADAAAQKHNRTKKAVEALSCSVGIPLVIAGAQIFIRVHGL